MLARSSIHALLQLFLFMSSHFFIHTIQGILLESDDINLYLGKDKQSAFCYMLLWKLQTPLIFLCSVVLCLCELSFTCTFLSI